MGRIARLLRIPKSKIVAKASGINHFTFFTEISRSDTGEDLYPRLRRLWQKRFFDYPPPVTATAKQLVKVPWVQIAVEQMYSPLVTHMFRDYGLLPCSVDSHIGEYVPFAQAVAGWHPVPVYFHQGVMARVEKMVTRYGNGESHLPMHRAGRSAEEVFPVIGAMWSGDERSLNAVNVPNRGYVPNLPDGAIVEVPAVADGQRGGAVRRARRSSNRWPSSCGPRSSCRTWWSRPPSREIRLSPSKRCAVIPSRRRMRRRAARCSMS